MAILHWSIKLSNRYIISKSAPCLVESKNSVIRRRLARFHRRTSFYSKSIDMISASLLLLFNEGLLFSINMLGSPIFVCLVLFSFLCAVSLQLISANPAIVLYILVYMLLLFVRRLQYIFLRRHLF